MKPMLKWPLLGMIMLPMGADSQGPPKLQLSKEEQKLVELTNKEREKEKLPPLTPNALLFQAARAHSANMASQRKMEHVLDDKTPAQRVEATGYDYKQMGENIAMSEGHFFTLPDIMKNWMSSEGHRKNILNPNFTEIGVGIAHNEQGETYYTQVFGTPREN
jgi:uncharacterized protein YkwD